MKGVGKRMWNAIDSQGLSIAAVAKRIDIKEKTLRNYLTDISEPKFDTLLNFCEITDVQVGDILRRGTDAHINFKLDQNDPDYVRIDFLDVGQNQTLPANRLIDRVAFNAHWLNIIGVDPAQASLVRVPDDQMAPTLSANDIVLIDRRDTHPISNQNLFVVQMGDNLAVRRAEYSANGSVLILHRDLAGAQTELLIADEKKNAPILGRVIWSGMVWAN